MADDYVLPKLDADGEVIATPSPRAPAREEEYRLPKLDDEGAVAETPDYGNMPWSEVGSRAVHNLPKSVYNNLVAIPEMVLHPSDTAHAFGELGKGVASKARGMFEAQDPAQKKVDERALDATLEPYTSVAGFKKTLAEDPISITSAVAAPFTGGASAGAASASRIGKIARGAAKAVADPASGVASLASHAAGSVAPTLRGAGAKLSGLSPNVIDTLYEVSRDEAHPFRNVFYDFADGRGDAERMSRAATDALSKVTDAAHQEWAKNKALVLGGSNQALPLDLVRAALDKAEQGLGNQTLNKRYAQSAIDELQALRDEINARNAAGHTGASAKELDIWKQLLWDRANEGGITPTQKSILDAARTGVKDTLTKHAPDYVELMKDYTDLQDSLNNIRKTLGTGDKVAANREIALLTKHFGTEEGRKLIEKLSAHAPELPYMIAGSLVSGLSPSGRESFFRRAFDASTGLAGMFGTIGQQSIWPAALAAGTYVGSHVATSPELVRHGTEAAAKVSRVADKVADATVNRIPAPVKKAAKAAVQAASPVATNVRRGQFNVEFAPEEERRAGGRVGRRAGGRIARALTADQLIAGLERSRNRQKKSTEPILNKPDESVVRALEIANQHI